MFLLPPIESRRPGDLAMDFLSTYAKQSRIPRPVVKDSATAVLMLLHRFARPDEQARLARDVPIASMLLGPVAQAESRPAILGWIRDLVAVAATGSRSIKESIKATGIRDGEVVPFVSALLQHVASHTNEAFATTLASRVPGLARLTGWPKSFDAER